MHQLHRGLPCLIRKSESPSSAMWGVGVCGCGCVCVFVFVFVCASVCVCACVCVCPCPCPCLSLFACKLSCLMWARVQLSVLRRSVDVCTGRWSCRWPQRPRKRAARHRSTIVSRGVWGLVKPAAIVKGSKMSCLTCRLALGSCWFAACLNCLRNIS